jgi:hypothetical protein
MPTPCADGRVIWVSILAVALGAGERFIAFCRDITEIREARLALEAHRAQLEELVEKSFFS